MTDRVVSLTVILDKEYRIDDVEMIKEAVQMIKGVSKVENGPIANVDTWFALTSVRQELLPKIIDLFNHDKFKKS